MTSLSGLDADEASAVASSFGVALEQVRRDHLISLILAALQPATDELVFFGGTALARSYLPAGRLSEDIALISTGDRRNVADRVTRLIVRGLRSRYASITWSKALTDVRDVEPVIVTTNSGISVRIQLLTADGYSAWPTTPTDLEQRYSDAPSTRLTVPTRDAFAAWKTAAWMDRAAPRDLFDLWALAQADALTSDAAALFAVHGPIRTPPQPWMCQSPPPESVWHEQLSGQTRLSVTAAEALGVVGDAWSAAGPAGPGDEDPPGAVSEVRES